MNISYIYYLLFYYIKIPPLKKPGDKTKSCQTHTSRQTPRIIERRHIKPRQLSRRITQINRITTHINITISELRSRRVNAIKLRATTRDCPYLQCRFCRGNPLWLPLNLMALSRRVRPTHMDGSILGFRTVRRTHPERKCH